MRLPVFFKNRMTEASLSVIFVIGFLALVLTSNGVFLSRASLQGFLTYLAVPITIGLAQMVVLCIGQMNLAVGTMGGVSCAIMAVLMADHNLPIWLAIIIGLLLLIRPINALFLCLIGLWDLNNPNDLKDRILSHWKQWLLFVFVVAIMMLPQLAYYKYVFGSYFNYSYGNETFKYLHNPQILKV